MAASDALDPLALSTSNRASTEVPSARAISVAGAGCAFHATASGPIGISGSAGATTTRSCATIVGGAVSLAQPAAPAITATMVQNQPLRPVLRSTISIPRPSVRQQQACQTG